MSIGSWSIFSWYLFFWGSILLWSKFFLFFSSCVFFWGSLTPPPPVGGRVIPRGRGYGLQTPPLAGEISPPPTKTYEGSPPPPARALGRFFCPPLARALGFRFFCPPPLVGAQPEKEIKFSALPTPPPPHRPVGAQHQAASAVLGGGKVLCA